LKTNMQEENRPQIANSQTGGVQAAGPQPAKPVENTSQPNPSTPAQPTNNQPNLATDGQMLGMSASQMGLSQPKSKFFDFNPKKLILTGIVVLVLLGGIFAVLLATNVIVLTKFKNIDYVDLKGNHYSLQFYAKHSTKTLSSGTTALVSKVSVDGKFPIFLSIDSTNDSGYARAKDCSGYTKVFDVQNDNLNQKISVCNVPTEQNTPNGVYIAGILYNNKASIVIFSQDLSGADLSSQSSAQQSLPKFGIDSYQDDIKKIVASIKVN